MASESSLPPSPTAPLRKIGGRDGSLILVGLSVAALACSVAGIAFRGHAERARELPGALYGLGGGLAILSALMAFAGLIVFSRPSERTTDSSPRLRHAVAGALAILALAVVATAGLGS
jgi:hypothetical protein